MRVQNDEGVGTGRPRAGVSIEVVIGVLAVGWGVIANSGRLTDNSFLTHLATGRIILDDGAVPSADPYSFTAAGADWTVQSWIPSIVYATAERMGGVLGLRIVGMALGGVAAWLLWRLTKRCESLLPRLALLFGTLGICASLWGLRPYMVGVIGLGIVWLVVDDAFAPWLLVPVFWAWANSHGSFPLGLGLIVLLAIGTRLDRDSPAVALRALGFAAVGTVAAVIGPLGLQALTFPLTALERADILRRIQEWQPAELTSLPERVYLLLVAAAVLSLIRRPRWRLALPAVVFIVAGMLARRNLVMATMVLAPIVAASLGEVGQLRTTDRPRMAPVLAALSTVAILIVGPVVAARPLGPLAAYPDRMIGMLGPGVRLAAPDYIGNVLHALDDGATPVFVDDRVDMYPVGLLEDSTVLVDATPEWEAVLDRWEIDLVVWPRLSPLASLVAADDDWRVWVSDTDWVLACRRGSCPEP